VPTEIRGIFKFWQYASTYICQATLILVRIGPRYKPYFTLRSWLNFSDFLKKSSSHNIDITMIYRFRYKIFSVCWTLHSDNEATYVLCN